MCFFSVTKWCVYGYLCVLLLSYKYFIQCFFMATCSLYKLKIICGYHGKTGIIGEINSSSITTVQARNNEGLGKNAGKQDAHKWMRVKAELTGRVKTRLRMLYHVRANLTWVFQGFPVRCRKASRMTFLSYQGQENYRVHHFVSCDLLSPYYVSGTGLHI